MNSVSELVKTHWLRQGIKLRRGASESEVTAFEAKYDVCLPKDMREFFSVVNGFDNRNGEVVDNDMITFFSLEEIERLNVSDWSIAAPGESHFVFADWSISAHVYAVRLSKDCAASGAIVVVYDALVKIADSFAEFMQAYLEDNKAVLFPEPQG
jgi:hypothetical protein